MNLCDIIIPVYNAYACVQRCIETVIAHTNLQEHTLVIINDASPDGNIQILLENFRQKHAAVNIVLLENETNLGFVQTVNRGMAFSQHDVLLLNSDTEVPRGWLDKIRRCAYSKEKVATVTPLSNSADWVSVPIPFRRNDIPPRWTLDEYQELIDKTSYREYPEIPSGHGFCLYIKRSVLNEVGFFDADTYGIGYGEEVDFCYRCFNYGYRHLLCDDAIVYHKERQSFLDTRDDRIKMSTEILRKRYQMYQEQLVSWYNRFPLRYLGKNIQYNLCLNNKKKNILIITHHNWKNAGDAVTLHIKDIIKGLKDRFNFHVLVPDDPAYCLFSYWTEGSTDEEEDLRWNRISSFSRNIFYNSRYEEMLDKIVGCFAVDIVHIHSLSGHFFDIGNVIKRNKLLLLVSLHDYDGETKPAGLGEEKSLSSWRVEWEKLLSAANRVIVPSASVTNETALEYEGCPQRDSPADMEGLRNILNRDNGEEESLRLAYNDLRRTCDNYKHSWNYRLGGVILALPKKIGKMLRIL